MVQCDVGVKKPLLLQSKCFQLLRLVLTNGTGALSTVRHGNVKPLKNRRKKKKLALWLDRNHKAGKML